MTGINIGVLRGLITLDDNFTSGLKTVEKNLQAFNTKFGQLVPVVDKVGKALSVGLSVPLLGIGAASTKAFMSFESAMKGVEAALTPTGKELQKLEAAALEWGAKTKFSATEAATALGELGKAGFNTNQSIAGLPSVLQLATISGMGLADAATVTADTLTQFNLEVHEAARVNDALVVAAQKSTVDVQQLAEALKYVGPVAAGFKVSLEDSLAALSAFGNAGIKADMAGTSLRNVLTDLHAPTKGMSDVMTKLGIDTFKSADGTIRLTNVIDKLRASGAAAEDVMLAFGDRAGPAMVAMVNQGSEALRALELVIKDSSGAAKEAADTMMSGLGGAIEEMRGSLETAGVAFGKILAPAISLAAKAIGSFADFMSGTVLPVLQEMPVPLKLIASGIAVIAVGIGPALIAVAALTQAMISMSAVNLSSSLVALGNTLPVLTVRVWLLDAAQKAATLSAGTFAAASNTWIGGLAARGATVLAGVTAAVAAWTAAIAAGGAAAAYMSAQSIELNQALRNTGPIGNMIANLTGFSAASKTAQEHTLELSEAIVQLNSVPVPEIFQARSGKDQARDDFFKAAAQNARDALKPAQDFVSQLKVVEDQVRSLSAADRAQIIAGKEMGATTEDLAKKFNVYEKTIDKVTDANQSAQKGMQKLRTEAENLRDELAGLNLLKALTDLTKAWNSLTPAQQANRQTVERATDAYNRLRPGLTNLNPVFERLRIVTGQVDRELIELTLDTDKMLTSLSKMPGVMNPAELAFDNLGLEVQDLSTYFGYVNDFKFEDITDEIKDFGEDLEEARKKAEQLALTIQDRLRSAFESLVDVEGKINLSGFVQNIGGQLVNALADNVTKSVTASSGAFAGGIAGGAFGIMGTMFVDAIIRAINSDENRRKTREAGLAMASQFADSFGGRANAARFLTMAGVGIDIPNKQADFSDLLDPFSAEKFNDAMTRALPKITALKQALDGLGRAAQGANQWAEIMAQSFETSMNDQIKAAEMANQAIIDAMKARGASSDEIDAKETQLAEALKDRTFQATEAQIAEFNRAGTVIGGVIANTVKRTGNLVEAVLAVGPALGSMSEIRDKFNLGDQLDVATAKVLGLWDAIGKNEDVFSRIGAVGEIMTGLGDAMVANTGLAQAFGQQLAADFETLKARGVDVNIALASMQPQLQQLWQLQRDGRITIDETTGALLAQAEAQGIVGTSMMSVNDKILNVLTEIRDLLGYIGDPIIPNIGKAAEGTIPGLTNMGNAGLGAAGNIEQGAIYAAENLDALGKRAVDSGERMHHMGMLGQDSTGRIGRGADVARDRLERMGGMGEIAGGRIADSVSDADEKVMHFQRQLQIAASETDRELRKVKSSFDTVGDAAERVGKKIRDKIPTTIPIDIEFRYEEPEFTIPDVPGFRSGTNGEYVDFGAGTLAMLHNREKIVPYGEEDTPRAQQAQAASQQMTLLLPDGTPLIGYVVRNERDYLRTRMGSSTRVTA